MKKFVLLVFIALNCYSYQCSDYVSDVNKLETLTFVATKVYGYNDVDAFCDQDKHIDMQLSFMPNYFRYQEEDDDHYKLMVHYDYSSCTFIYNITKKHISEKSCYSTW